MIATVKRLTIATFFVLFCQTVSANDSFDVNGHSKYRLFVTEYPDDSIYRQYLGDDANDQNIDIRLNLNWQQSAWRFQADYQFITLYGDTLEFSGQLPPLIFSTDTIQNDDHRLLDLTRVIHEEDDLASLHRLDRLYFGYASGPTVIRFGRQAISWGNGLIYTPMDFFNPFDPSAIDKEYKTGDDMLYGQYLFDSGNDMQAIRVIRRNDEGDINNNVSSTAFKYHGLVGNSEYDLLLAQHYNNNIIGIGGNTSLGGAVLRGDITFTETDTNTISSLVTGVSYSWVWGSTNYSGVLEYFYNGFGINNGDYSPAILIQNPDLLQRIQRGEIYSLGKRYLATSLTIELTPLWLITPSIYHSLSDGSSLFQLLSRHDLSQNLQLLLAIHSPSGSSGTEYGGIPSGIDNLNLGNGNRFFAQLGWYF